MKNRLLGLTLAFILALLCPVFVLAQDYVSGRVTDETTGETLPRVHVYYDDARHSGVIADDNGRYSIAFRQGRTLNFNTMGYEPKSIITNRPGTRNIRLREATYGMDELVVERKRSRYSRKNNPAVEMMRRVIAAKNNSNVEMLPYCSYNIYEKQTCSINEFPDSTLGAFSFLRDYVERNNLTGKQTLPLMVEENVKQRVHRLAPHADRTYVLARRTSGVNELFTIGGQLNVVLGDVFQDVDIYRNDVRLFQRHFLSPIADDAVSFYRYYIEDTLHTVPRTYRLTFTPNNPRDFGFSGELIVEDSTWQVNQCEVNIPSQSGVNFVEELRVVQQFETLDGGRRVLTANDMLVQMSLYSFLTKMQVQRTTRRSGFAFDSIPDSRFAPLAKEIVTPEALTRDDDYWTSVRPVGLTMGESRMDSLVEEVEGLKWFKAVRFVLKAYGEDFIETRKTDSKFDIGPIRKLFSYNKVEGFRLLGGLQTTAHLNQHLYFQGYAAYGFRDRRWKGLADLTYSFRRNEYRPHEFPVHSLSLTYSNELMTAADRKNEENRSDIFSIFSFMDAEHKMYQEKLSLRYQREWANGLLVTASANREWLTPTGLLFYQPLSGSATPGYQSPLNLRRFSNTEFNLCLRYQPGNTYVNSKKSRHETNKDAPIIQVEHTYSPPRLWGNRYTSNCTEFELYYRQWLSSWGRMDFTLRGAWQWNKVPFPLLNTPDANLTYIMMRRRFCLMNDMEFLNDHNLSLHWKWDLAGKLFNRIPLLRRLKLRETIGCNILWGELSAKNDPATSGYTDSRLWHMPGRWVAAPGQGQATDAAPTVPAAGEGLVWQPYSYALDRKKPYIELYAGVFNIFKFFNVTYVHRLNYNYHPDTSRWGIRVGMEFAF